MLSVTDDNFQEVLGAPVALVDFWSPLCPHCVDFKPTFEEIAAEYHESVLVVAAKMDDCEKTADHYNVDGLPTLVFLRDGEEVHRTEGGMSKDELKALIADKLGV